MMKIASENEELSRELTVVTFLISEVKRKRKVYKHFTNKNFKLVEKKMKLSTTQN